VPVGLKEVREDLWTVAAMKIMVVVTAIHMLKSCAPKA